MSEGIFLTGITLHQFTEMIRDVVRHEINNIKSPVQEEFLSRDEVSAILHLSKVTLYNLSKKGILTPKKVGGRVLYTRSQIDNVVNKLGRKGMKRIN